MKRYSEDMPLVEFRVDGQPIPKQSFRALKRGGGYRSPRASAWQAKIALAARESMFGREPLNGALAVDITFWRCDRTRVDLDNLTKGCMDGCNGIVWNDDQQVVELHLRKFADKEHPGVVIEVYRAIGE